MASTGRWAARGALAGALALAGACAADGAASAAAGAASTVQGLIGDAGCDTDAQCRTIGVGAKACGGPQAYLAWSTLRTDAAALRTAADREAEAARAESAARGMVSNCSVVPDPGAFCALPSAASAPGAPRGVCRLRGRGPGQGGRVY